MSSHQSEGQARQRSTASDDALKELSNNSLEMRLSDPWVRALPMEVIIPLQLETIAQSKATLPFQLLVTARNILEYIQEANGLDTLSSSNRESRFLNCGTELDKLPHQNIAAAQFPSLLRVFDTLFQRIESTRFDSEDSANLKKLYDYVWSCHLQDKIDFSKSPVIGLLLEKHPEYLEPFIVECLTECNSERLLNLSRKNCVTFRFVFKIFCQMYHFTKRHSTILDFVQEFIEDLEASFAFSNELDGRWTKVDKYISMYQDAFQPLLSFISRLDVKAFCNGKLGRSQQLVQNELLEGIDDLLKTENDHIAVADLDLKLFFLATNRVTMNVITVALKRGLITLKQYTHLWSVLHKVH